MSKGYFITLEVDGRVVVADGPPATRRLDVIQKAVGGYAEAVPMMQTVDLRSIVHAGLSVEATSLMMMGRRRCAAFCNEEGKLEGLAVNQTATQVWAETLVHHGHMKPNDRGAVLMPDMLVGNILFVVGDDAYMDEL